MTIIMCTILLFLLLLLFINNLLPLVTSKHHWLFKSPIYIVAALAYIFLIPRIIQPDPNNVLSIAINWLPSGTVTLTNHMLINNQNLILLTCFATLFLFRNLLLLSTSAVNKTPILPEMITVHQNNILLGLFISGLFLILSDNLVYLLFAQIILTCVIIYQQITFELINSDSARSSGFLWSILADLLLLLAILFWYKHHGTLAIPGMQDIFMNFEPIHTIFGIFALSSFIIKLCIIPYRQIAQNNEKLPHATVFKNNSVEMILMLLMFLYKIRVLFCASSLLLTIILGFIIAIIAPVISIAINDPNRIFKYLLISQAGVFMIIIGNDSVDTALILLISFGFANFLLLNRSTINTQTNQKASRDKFSFSSISNWIRLFAAAAVCGFPISAGFIPRSVLTEIYFEHALKTPVTWLYIVLIFVILSLFSFSAFRYLFANLGKSTASVTAIATGSLRSKIIIGILVFLNLSIIFTLPKVNPLLNVSWINQLIYTSGISIEQPNQTMVITSSLVTVPLLIGFVVALLTYYFEIVNVNKIQKLFNPISKAVQFIGTINDKIIINIDLLAHKSTEISEYIEKNIILNVHRKIVRSTHYSANLVIQINQKLTWKNQSSGTGSKFLISFKKILIDRGNLIPLMIIIIILITLIISII